MGGSGAGVRLASAELRAVTRPAPHPGTSFTIIVKCIAITASGLSTLEPMCDECIPLRINPDGSATEVAPTHCPNGHPLTAPDARVG